MFISGFRTSPSGHNLFQEYPENLGFETSKSISVRNKPHMQGASHAKAPRASSQAHGTSDVLQYYNCREPLKKTMKSLRQVQRHSTPLVKRSPRRGIQLEG